jgi:hypothetical protein
MSRDTPGHIDDAELGAYCSTDARAFMLVPPGDMYSLAPSLR